MQIPILPQQALFNFLLTKAIADQAILKAMASSQAQVNQAKVAK